MKELVSKASAPSDDEKSALSEQFCKSLSNDILHVSAFYVEKLEKARDAVEKLRLQESINVDKYLKAPGESSTTVSLQKLLEDEENGLDQSTRVAVESMYNLLDELQALRKYVATNVIAVTKIVKKT